MKRNDHFETAVDWAAAARLVDFEPRRPAFTAGFDLVSLAVHVMDHRKRRLPIGARSLEAHYGAFVIDQKRMASPTDAKRRALSTPYGPATETVRVAGFEGRGYALGPEPDPDDIDGRSPAVIVWSDGAMFYLVASDQLDKVILLRIASSMYDRDGQPAAARRIPKTREKTGDRMPFFLPCSVWRVITTTVRL